MITPNKLPKKAVSNLTDRLTNEYEAHRVYRYVSNCLRNKGFEIAADYYASEAADELTHAEKLQKFASDWNVELELKPLGKVEVPEETLDGIVSYTYTMEYNLLKAYQKDYMDAFEDGDLYLAFFLKELIDIQSKSVAEISDKINAMQLFDTTDKNWLFNFEKKVFKV